MAEMMLVTQALDERDLLVKKITDKISKLELLDCKRRNEDRTLSARISEEDFTKQAESSFQQVVDLIARYQRLDAAIISSNASTLVETSKGKMSVAAAIASRNRLKGTEHTRGSYPKEANFEEKLISLMKDEFRIQVQLADDENKKLETQAETMRLSILGKDTKSKDEKPLEVVDAYIRENTMELIDPLHIKKKAQEMRENLDALLKEVDTVIKVSNATTMIEF